MDYFLCDIPRGNSELSAQVPVELTKRPDVATRMFQGLASGPWQAPEIALGFVPFAKVENERKFPSRDSK